MEEGSQEVKGRSEDFCILRTFCKHSVYNEGTGRCDCVAGEWDLFEPTEEVARIFNTREILTKGGYGSGDPE